MLIKSVDKSHNTHIATGSKFKLGYLNILEHWIKTKKMKCKKKKNLAFPVLK